MQIKIKGAEASAKPGATAHQNAWQRWSHGQFNDRSGLNPVFEVMSAARPLFHRKRKSIGGSAPTSLLADQQKKRSDAN
jgi:hypothetical protein